MMSEHRGAKVRRGIEKYGLDELQEELRQRRDSGESLRELATYVNKRFLEQALAEADVDLVIDVEGLYRLLTDDDVSIGRRTEVESKLTRNSVPVEDIRDDFVSHQTIRHYLNHHLDVDTDRQTTLSKEDALDRIDWARSRNEGIIENTLDQLDRAGQLDTCDLDLVTSARVTCKSCKETYTIADLVQRGRCGCDEEPTEPK